MANGHGGYRAPSNPAQVSGPGSLSQRTDKPQPAMQLSNPKYGEQQDFQQIQQGAPMQAPPGPPTPGPGAGGNIQLPTPISAPSTMPNQPVTAGANAGPGPDSSVLNLPPGDDRQTLRAMYGPILPALIAESQSKYATQSFKDSVAALISIM